jgi:hypothetical protein
MQAKWLNAIPTPIPLGSILIQKDYSYTLTIAGINALSLIMIISSLSEEDTRHVASGVGGSLFLVSFVYSIVWRSTHHTKPILKVTTVTAVPGDLKFAVLPDANGNIKAGAIYSLEF